MHLNMLDLEKYLIIIITVFSLGMPNGSVKGGGSHDIVSIPSIFINRRYQWMNLERSLSIKVSPDWTKLKLSHMCSHVSRGLHVVVFSLCWWEGGRLWGGDSCAVRCDHPTGVYETRPGGCQVIQTPKHKHTYTGLSLPDSGCLLCVRRSHFCLIHYFSLGCLWLFADKCDGMYQFKID